MPFLQRDKLMMLTKLQANKTLYLTQTQIKK